MTMRRTALAAWLAAASVAPTPPAAAQPADALFRGFEPTGDWQLVVDGEAVPKARIFDSTRAQALLVLSSAFPSPVLIDRAGRTVATLDLMKVAERADGTVDLLADALLEPAGALEVGQAEGRFRVGGRAAAVRPLPWKLGPQRGADLLAGDAGYRWRAGRFAPDAEVVRTLRGESRDVRVLTFFGTWCPHCRQHLPLLLDVERELEGGRIRFDYYGLPSPFRGEPEASKWGVDGVPTAIVLVGGREVGRIPASGWARPEVALRDVLRAADRGAAADPG
jgi:thiol-disulfide isomerase/thioredoxin